MYRVGVATKKNVAACLAVQHEAYCESKGSKPPLMRCTAQSPPGGAHDKWDEDPSTQRYCVTDDNTGEVYATARLIDYVPPWAPEEIRIGSIREINRVASSRSLMSAGQREEVLLLLLGFVIRHSLESGCSLWVAELRAGFLEKLGQQFGMLLVPYGEPIYPDPTKPGQPLSGEVLLPHLIPLGLLMASMWATRPEKYLVAFGDYPLPNPDLLTGRTAEYFRGKIDDATKKARRAYAIWSRRGVTAS